MLKEIIPGWCLGELIPLGIIMVGLAGVALSQFYLIWRDKRRKK